MISQSEYKARRRTLMNAMEPGGIAIVSAASEIIRNNDSHYAFRQNSDFSYLTGFEEPDALLVLAPGRTAGQSILFCRPRNATLELWDGPRAGPEGVVADYGMDAGFPIEDRDDVLPGLLEGCDQVYYSMGRNHALDSALIGYLNRLRSGVRSGVATPGQIVDLDHLLHDMRLVKSATEQKLMKKAADISADAHSAAIRTCKPGLCEYHLQAEIEYHFRRQGASGPAYGSIVGAGANACVLHYRDNSAGLRDGELVLIDAGCEYHNYAADITRTFPVSGTFSKEQRQIYELVLRAQKAAIEVCRPGARFCDPHLVSVRVLTEGLVELGLLPGPAEARIEDGSYMEFYPHRAGHWLGLDVHDVGSYKLDDKWRVLEPGMVLTVEPGLYIQPGTKAAPKKWHGIGVRIEDDVLITKDAPEVLSAAVPKEADAIEAMMAA